MTINEKIEKIFAQESDNRPEWASELLKELKEIKLLLQQQKQEIQPQPKKHDYSFYDFLSKFRKSMMADVQNNIYPEIEYQGEKIGVNFKGYLYYKKDGKLLSRANAIKVYRNLYELKKYAV